MTTETLVTSGQPDNATASSQPAPGATDNTGAQPDAKQQQQASTEANGQPAAGAQDQSATDDGKSGDGKDATDGDKPAGAPEQYEDFKAPDGVTLDAEVTGEFKALAKELNLPQEKAQQVADLGAKLAQKWQAQQATALTEAAAKWAADSQADKEFGGDKLQENLATAKKALDTFGSPELKTLLNESGLGNHPEIIRMLFKAGTAISEDRLVAGKPGATPVQSTAQRMYPNMNP
jgi:hypothetical protein